MTDHLCMLSISHPPRLSNRKMGKRICVGSHSLGCPVCSSFQLHGTSVAYVVYYYYLNLTLRSFDRLPLAVLPDFAAFYRILNPTVISISFLRRIICSAFPARNQSSQPTVSNRKNLQLPASPVTTIQSKANLYITQI